MSRQIVLFMQLLLPVLGMAQKINKKGFAIQYLQGIQVDGELNEWGDHLYNKESELWNFAVSTENNTLYVAVKLKDQRLIEEAIRYGIFVDISYSEKKRDGAQLIFPRVNLEKLERMRQPNEEDKGWNNQELIQSAKGYYVIGFNRIVNGLLSFNNDYGIQAVAVIDSVGDFNYEAKIPLQWVDFTSKEFAVNLGVNTQLNREKVKKVKPMNVGRGNGPSTSSSSIKNPYVESLNVWFTGIVE